MPIEPLPVMPEPVMPEPVMPEPVNPNSPLWLYASLGVLVFLNVYAPQSLLPLLAKEFKVGPAAVGAVVGMTMLAMALTSPLVGILADRWGRRKTIIWAFGLLTLPALLAALAPSLVWLNAARFGQGLLIAGVLVAINAYIGEEVHFAARGRALSAYVTGTIFGGFLGRFLAGIVANQSHWHAVFWGLMFTCTLGWVLARQLPPELNFRPQQNSLEVWQGLKIHLKNGPLLATCAVGFLILFTLVGTFNTLTLYLSGPPYGLNTAQTGLIFTVYLLGVVITPVAGPLLALRGPSLALILAVSLSVLGLLLTLLQPLPWIIAGISAASCGVFLTQSLALAAVQRQTVQARSLASGLYHFAYYGGAACASLVAGHVFEWGTWSAVVALVILSMILAGVAGVLGWRGS